MARALQKHVARRQDQTFADWFTELRELAGERWAKNRMRPIRLPKENVVTLGGEEMRTHEQIDAHFTPAFGPEDEDKFNRFVERLRPRRLSDAERAERDRARHAAHDELARKEAVIAEVEQRIGYREIEVQQESANDAVWDAEYDVMEAEPATTAGAVAFAALRRRLDGNLLQR